MDLGCLVAIAGAALLIIGIAIFAPSLLISGALLLAVIGGITALIGLAILIFVVIPSLFGIG